MVGVFLCSCGTNIAGIVDIDALRDFFLKQGHVVEDHLFLCSQAGQDLIKKTVREKGLDRIVIASCSPKHHWGIFKDCVGEVINPYMWEMANIREQCAWTTLDKEKATQKAKALVSGAIQRVQHHNPIGSIDVPVLKRIAVIGAGIAGMHASLELADKGFEVILVERESNLGGNMVRLDRTFPTDDCAMCTVSPILNDVMMNKRIKIHTMTKVDKFEGRPGEYRLTLQKRPRYVDYLKCTGCGACGKSEVQVSAPMFNLPFMVDRIRIGQENCTMCGACSKACFHGAISQVEKKTIPLYDRTKCVGCWKCREACKFEALQIINVCPVVVPSEFDLGLGYRKAVFIPNSQAVPLKYLRDPIHCLKLNGTMDCQGCASVCGPGAILEDDSGETLEILVGAVVVATGYQEYDLSGTEYHVDNPNVVTGLQLERLLSPAGPTGGKLVRPSDGLVPKTVTFIQCAGSRDIDRKEYCSKICCMYATKNARLIKSDHPEIDVKVCYTDLRAAGRGYEEYFDKAREMGIEFIRGQVGEVVPYGDRLIVKCEDTFLGRPIELPSDLVVLSAAMEPSIGTIEMEKLVPLVPGKDGFIAPMHIKIAPVDTTTMGIFICGTAESPKPIQECITDAGAAASRVASFLQNNVMTVDLVTACIDLDRCTRCGKCKEICVYDAIRVVDGQFEVVDISCRACGKCAADCPTNAIDLRLNDDIQLESSARGIMQVDKDSIIAYSCEQCGYNAADLAGTAKNFYSTEIKIIKVPCSGRVSLAHMLLPFEMGAKGVMLAACLEDQCHFIDGNKDSKKRVELAKRTLDLMGIGGDRLQFFNVSSAEGDKFVQAVKKILNDTKED